MFKNIIKRYFLVFLMIIILASMASAFCWKCRINYDGSVSYTCDYSVCNWHECSEEGIPVGGGECGDPGNIDAQPPNLSVNSPIDGVIYNTGEVFIQGESDEIVKTIRRKVDSESYRTMCSSCESGNYMKTGLRDGEHSVIVSATDFSGNTAMKTVYFTVDSTAPNIKYTYPGNNFYVKGSSNDEFKVRYDEENVDEIILYYRINAGNEQSIQFNGCEDGEDKECSVLVDLSSSSEGNEVEFYVKIKDKAGNEASSDNKVATVNAEYAENPLIISSPIDNEKFGERRLDLNIESVLNADMIEYSIDGNRFRRLCIDCDGYEGLFSARDGEHELVVRATYEETKVEEKINFYVDSIKPRIRTTTPRMGSWVKGKTLFSISYSELNLESIILHYGIEGEGSVELSGCESGNNKECSIEVDLSGYNGEEILYFFEVKDKINSVSSKNYNLLVDVDKPIISLNSPDDGEIYTSPRVLFDLELDGEVETLEYIDDYEGARGLKPRTLCRRCDSYQRLLGFREGEHDVKIMATDQAGNTNEINLNFIIETSYPRFSRISTYGRGVTNGEFTLSYDESNLVEVIGYYKGLDEENYKTKSFGDCPSGRRQECEVRLDLDEYHGEEIEYYFTLIDVLGQAVTSNSVGTVMVDTDKPFMEVNMEDMQVFENRRVLFDIELDEDVQLLEYKDNIYQRYRRLCSSCDGYERAMRFREGAYSVTFRATDFAGNEVEETKNFIVTY